MSTLFLELIFIFVSAIYFLFLLFLNTCHDKSGAFGNFKQAPKSMMETLHRLKKR